MSEKECPFCGRVERGEYDQWNPDNVAFAPLNPVTAGHLLVVPRVHVEDARSSPPVTGRAFEFAAWVARLMRMESFNLIASAGADATQSVFHLHVHVVPRREGDGLRLPWTGQQR